MASSAHPEVVPTNARVKLGPMSQAILVNPTILLLDEARSAAKRQTKKTNEENKIRIRRITRWITNNKIIKQDNMDKKDDKPS